MPGALSLSYSCSRCTCLRRNPASSIDPRTVALLCVQRPWWQGLHDERRSCALRSSAACTCRYGRRCRFVGGDETSKRPGFTSTGSDYTRLCDSRRFSATARWLLCMELAPRRHYAARDGTPPIPLAARLAGTQMLPDVLGSVRRATAGSCDPPRALYYSILRR
jgi:hypothetical protein